MILINFWKRVKDLIKQKGLTEIKVAQTCGIPVSTFTGWMYKGFYPSVYDGYNIARALGVSIEYLMTGKEKHEKPGNTELENIRLLLHKVEDRLDKMKL
ncbi:helix-turn-helix domain-containing protein [Leadbettera azotonutricia]|uniref:DNA-binding protein n=1 Tax=Leadbettera azotonutricia (strain ATCC BAA-888 / DSM 13862 / ZAS-9) TaxID=545695 RepID=F5YBC6_LEAAZ|nr:helix-turn-helix transcriptional regulator [Leadbettera azotonutricia]AEF82344.1 DNA-binding protein [Leadbettera azotonutricia ZAS-9]